jgi:hypothetical protein
LRNGRKEKKQHRAVEMTVRGKAGKPKAGFPAFPLPLETPQNRRAFHIPTAPTTVLIYTAGKPKNLAQNINPEGGPN